MTKKLEYSVILPVCHGGRYLRKALVSSRHIDFPLDCFEILVVGEDDDEEVRRMVEAENIIAGFDIIYIGCSSSKRSAQLNAACAVARGRYLVFADDDCLFLPDWLQRLHKVFKSEHNVGVVGGLDELVDRGEALDLALNCTLNSFAGTGGSRQKARIRLGKYYPKLWNMAIPREIALKASIQTKDGSSQIFNESLVVYEDVELVKRIGQLGTKVIFAPEVRVRHYRSTTFWSILKRNFKMAKTCRKIGVHRLSHMMLDMFLLIGLLLMICSIFFQPSRIVFLTYVGIYIIILLYSGVKGLVRTKNLLVFVLIPSLLISVHVARAAGYLFPWSDYNRARLCQ